MSSTRKPSKEAQLTIDFSQTIPGFVSLAPRLGSDHQYLDKGDRKADQVEYVWIYATAWSYPTEDTAYHLAVIELATGEVLDSIEVDPPMVNGMPAFGCPVSWCALYAHPNGTDHREVSVLPPTSNERRFGLVQNARR